jgi:threonine synthase
VRPDEKTVALITGDGLKTIEAIAETARPTMTIPSSLEAFSAELEAQK